MSAAAVLRSACGALRRPSPFLRGLHAKEQRFLHRSPAPRDTISPRRLYSSDCVELNKHPHQDRHFFERHLGPPGRLHRHENLIVPKKISKVEERIFLRLDEVEHIFDRRGIMLKELGVAVREKIKRDRRRRLLVRGSIFVGLVGLAVYVKKHFFTVSQEANKGMPESN